MYIPHQVLIEITEDFSDKMKIGSGGYGVVYRGVHKDQDIAVKVLHPVEARLHQENPFGNEFLSLMNIEHPHVVRLVGYCYETKHKHVQHKGELRFSQDIFTALCFEYLQGGSLEKYLKDSHDYDWPTCYNIIKGICEGLNFLHARNILHLDLKPANILLDKNMAAKVADFGLSRFFAGINTQITNNPAGTRDYMAPEYWHENKISPKNDVYSLGIIIIQIISGYTGYTQLGQTEDVVGFIEQANKSWRERINTTQSPRESAESNQVETCLNLAMKCVDGDRKNRPTVAEIVRILKETEEGIPEERWRNRAQFLMHQDLSAMARNSPSGTFNPNPVPDKPKMSAVFSEQLDLILGAGRREPLSVVVVYGFDCTTYTPAWYKMNGVYWLVVEKLTHLVDNIGYIYSMSTPNTYRTDMKLVDSAETRETGYKPSSAWRMAACTGKMACGLKEAHKLINNIGNANGIILLFSDGSTHMGDYFDGAKEFISMVPVHTFILFGQG
ncbi:unnamed protein product [Alopecurus aequalis]